jgi:large subunit ribosomal protein L5e
VVRITNRYVICQIVYAEIDKDRVLVSANSAELEKYGLKFGLKNYAAAYCTGLLVARRALTKLNMADKYEGNTEVTGKVVKVDREGSGGKTRTHYVAAVDEERKPFRVYLDVGIRMTTTGARIFGAMKGAADGGLDIPHNEKRFPGWNKDNKKYDPDELRARIMGEHVQDYQNKIREDDQEQFEKMWSKYVAEGQDPDELPELYASIHEKIREDPSPAPKAKLTIDKKYKKPAKKSLADRKASLAAKKAKGRPTEEEMDEDE